MRRIFLSSKDFSITAAPIPPNGAGPSGGGAGNLGGPAEQHPATNEPGPNVMNFECPDCGKKFNEGGIFKDHLREDHGVRDSVR